MAMIYLNKGGISSRFSKCNNLGLRAATPTSRGYLRLIASAGKADIIELGGICVVIATVVVLIFAFENN